MSRERELVIRADREEIEQLKLAARLRHLPLAEYIKRALNAQMRREGVDAVLFAVPDRGGMTS